MNRIQLKIKIVVMSFVTIFFMACTDKPDDLVVYFNKANEHIHRGEYDFLVDKLDSMSTAYLDEITNPDNHNVQIIKKIGHKYKLRITSLVYYYQMADHPDEVNRKLNFFRFLSLNQYPWFDLKREFKLLEEKIRKDSIRKYVPIVTQENDENYLYWTAFRKNGNNQFDFDLMYSLILMEDKLKRRYEPAIRAQVPGISNDEILDGLWAQWELKPFEPYDFDKFNFDRRSNLME